MEVVSLGYRTDLMIRQLAGAEIADRGSHLVIRTPENPDFWWGNFVLLPPPSAGDDMERWIETFRREFPRAGHIALGVDGVDGLTADRDDLQVELDVVLSTSRLAAPPAWEHTAQARPLTTDEDWAQLFHQRIAGLADAPSPEYLRFLARSLDAEQQVRLYRPPKRA